MTRTLLEWARRHQADVVPDDGNLVEALREGTAPAEIARQSGFPLPVIQGVQSFYDLLHGPDMHDGPRRCTGTACTFAEGFTPPARGSEVHCAGRCYDAPVRLERGAFPIPRKTLVDTPVVFRHLFGPRPSLATLYALPDADTILDVIEDTALRGRGPNR
jgi:hypothetical protein